MKNSTVQNAFIICVSALLPGIIPAGIRVLRRNMQMLTCAEIPQHLKTSQHLYAERKYVWLFHSVPIWAR